MSNEGDRRATGATRIPFEALVEVSPSLGPSFEAQAVDVSGEGMHLRTAYLPEVGQPLMCRFDAGSAGGVNASGEVVWREEGERGGEFGMRFVDLDDHSVETLSHMVGVREKVIQPSGAKVRLHIEGLGFPMRARVKDASRKELTVGNELGFLQVGKQLELEDAETGEKRPAAIDRVEVEIDPESRVPRLVVGLRYSDEPESMPIARAEQPEEREELEEEMPPKDSTPEPSVMESEPAMDSDEDESHGEMQAKREIDEESNKLKSAFARNAAKVTPAILGFAKRAKATAGVLWANRKQRAAAEAPQKRTTAPPPAGGLHASGRKVVRATDVVATPKSRLDTKRKVAIGAGAGLAVVLAFAALHKTPKTQAAQDKPVATDATAVAAQPPPLPEPAPLPIPAPTQQLASAPVLQQDTPDETHHAKKGHVTPFGNGAVAHGNVLRLKMDGPIDKINGAAQPDGFSVSIPGHRALEPAGPLASRDARLASIKVTNDQGGASLDVAFKDGVPGYLVRAKGDTLEIVLAAPGKIGGEENAQPPSHASAQASKKKPTHKK